MCGEALVNEIHCHTGCLVPWWKLLHLVQLPPVLKIQQTCVGTVPPSLLWTTLWEWLAVWGREGECGPLPCAVDSVLILSLVSSK